MEGGGGRRERGGEKNRRGEGKGDDRREGEEKNGAGRGSKGEKGGERVGRRRDRK